MKRLLLSSIILIAVAITLLTLFACNKNEEGIGVDETEISQTQFEENYDATVMKIGDYVVSLREMQFRYNLQKNNMLTSYGSLVNLMGLDTSRPFSEQPYGMDTDISWSKYVLDNTITELSQMVYFYNEAVLSNYCDSILTQTEDYLTQYMQRLTENANLYQMETDYYIMSVYGEGMDSSWIYEYVRRSYVAASYYSFLTQNFSITEEEYQNYYSENEEQCLLESYNTVSVRHILIVPKTVNNIYLDEGETLDEDSMKKEIEAEDAAAKEKIEAILEEWQKNGGTIELFSDYAAEFSQDTDSASLGGRYYEFQKGYFLPEFDEWCFDESRSSGDYEIIKTDLGYHLMYFDDYGKPLWKIMAEIEINEKKYYELISDFETKYIIEKNEEMLEVIEKNN